MPSKLALSAAAGTAIVGGGAAVTYGVSNSFNKNFESKTSKPNEVSTSDQNKRGTILEGSSSGSRSGSNPSGTVSSGQDAQQTVNGDNTGQPPSTGNQGSGVPSTHETGSQTTPQAGSSGG
ncbi:hypothetical protein [Candidatus Mycoplasma haematohominis]|uniref:hypothetical protein n=1 Tax=Candidatus Mycoplasma haematohominis TaxID=1494318 RepID=UPI001C0A6FC2|nr:hypothetical protein [Candidatus Mycoplasma haemohominis]